MKSLWNYVSNVFWSTEHECPHSIHWTCSCLYQVGKDSSFKTLKMPFFFLANQLI